MQEALERSHRIVAHARAEREGEPLGIEDVDGVGEQLQASIDRRGIYQALFRSEQGAPVLLVRRHGEAIEVSVAAEDSSQAGSLAESIASLLRVERKPRDPRVSVAFWSGTGDAVFGGHEARWRRLALPSFSEIETNYPGNVRERLGEMFGQPSGHALPGRLALWHGPPGTGKTWALRALGQEWSAWCDLHYVTDPERLLGGDTGYMLAVLAGRSDPPVPGLDEDEETADREAEPSERWRLLVLEDAGELLGVGAPAEVGRGFARLLNIVDGLLGQGTRALILVTTNEPLGKLHPAALRPGRAMATVEFAPLSPTEATAWLCGQGLDREIDTPKTIAELHAMVAGTSTAPNSRTPVGFG